MTFSSLDHPIRWLFFFHALAGALALFVLVVPMISKKGSQLHIRTGWVYTGAMIFVGLSALVITPWRIFYDPEKNLASESFAVFLFYVAVFTLTAVSFGIFSLKNKQRTSASRSALHIGPPLVTVLFGLGIQMVGFKLQNMLLMTFPFLGHFTAVSQIKYWMAAPTEKMHWWYAHMNGMFTACIATITAFLVTAIPRIWPGPLAESPILWVAPGLILGTVLNRWTASFRKKHSPMSNTNRSPI